MDYFLPDGSNSPLPGEEMTTASPGSPRFLGHGFNENLIPIYCSILAAVVVGLVAYIVFKRSAGGSKGKTEMKYCCVVKDISTIGCRTSAVSRGENNIGQQGRWLAWWVALEPLMSPSAKKGRERQCNRLEMAGEIFRPDTVEGGEALTQFYHIIAFLL